MDNNRKDVEEKIQDETGKTSKSKELSEIVEKLNENLAEIIEQLKYISDGITVLGLVIAMILAFGFASTIAKGLLSTILFVTGVALLVSLGWWLLEDTIRKHKKEEKEEKESE